MENKKNYYAIIPADVRYNKNLTANAKLLYGEITALCNKEGYCWASNKYFAELYKVSHQSISAWISALKNNNHIKISLSGQRKIYIDPSKKLEGGHQENLHHNNTVIIHNNTIKESCPKNFEDVKEYFILKESTKDEAESFNDYFTNKDWRLNNNKKMIDWRLAANNWIKRSKIFNNKPSAGGWSPSQSDGLYKKRIEDNKYKDIANSGKYPEEFIPELLKHLTNKQIIEYKKELKKCR